jgi:DNA-directed RNA polymerase specialized sigma24 family protein
MGLSAAIAPHLPYLRRFARAVSGSQESGDAMVAAMLEAIIADTSIFPEASSDRIALYRIFAKLFTSVVIRVPQGDATTSWEQHAAANLEALAPLPRQAFLLIAVEGFSEAEGAEILGVSESRFADLLTEASSEISRQVATDVLIIEDGRHCPHAFRGCGAVCQNAPENGACRHPARRRQFGYRRGQRNPADDVRAGDLHHRLPRTVADRRAA